ncbi:phosphoribosyltransferase [Aliidiomarina haloalkalitolerans]|uniref:Phosphoribosyltransferase domain-containing protein n=1 Tax=Aliidiomarina haloalkalitolerans TaxID=859059 RepID=A0A432VQY5_9GAMM|nr:phosphoribosyltransferase [Aliidiomarina haloalkalitolerans]RUO18684.1 hypothetical protein CWE06_10605 [Aliidiomarina haloalkalitolerans]
MGIDVTEDKYVTLNEGHHKRLVTCPSRNPVFKKYPGLVTQSVYRRTKDGDKERDGNPFIYALKKTRGYRIRSRELVKFKPSFDAILYKIIDKFPGACLVTLPSSYPIAEILARRIARKNGAQIFNRIFRKATVAEVLANFDPHAVKKQHQAEINSQLATFNKLDPNELVNLKEMRNRIRSYFNPISINSDLLGQLPTTKLLLVDDLLSTGTTITNAANLLKYNNFTVVGAVCLFSAL